SRMSLSPVGMPRQSLHHAASTWSSLATLRRVDGFAKALVATKANIHDASAQKPVNELRQTPKHIQRCHGSDTPKGDLQPMIALKVTKDLRPCLNSDHEQRGQQYDADKP